MPRRKIRNSVEHVSEFDKRRILAYRYCGLSFREIGAPVGRNQVTSDANMESVDAGETDGPKGEDCTSLATPPNVIKGMSWAYLWYDDMMLQ